MSETLRIQKNEDTLIINYYIYNYPNFKEELFRALKTNGSYRLKKTFKITFESLLEHEDEECVCFKIGSLQDGFYKLDSEVFELENNFY
ncbi:hypothetical protein [Staphylococcus sp. GDY8P196P]|uniref:hypothetical protein n=1 Tax=Staphylococcus sp. GDY8P196P TaxID=2804172 RepID=UPI001AEC51DF|nr:hypothetical protein [Staphylococcus sp. GDY8P196P]